MAERAHAHITDVMASNLSLISHPHAFTQLVVAAARATARATASATARATA